jgi:hypothetical protein
MKIIMTLERPTNLPIVSFVIDWMASPSPDFWRFVSMAAPSVCAIGWQLIEKHFDIQNLRYQAMNIHHSIVGTI